MGRRHDRVMRPSSLHPSYGLSVFSLLAIVVTGVIPIWGVLTQGWSAVQIVILFWMETLIVGVFTWMRLRDTERNPDAREPFRMSGFFLLHYGLFWLVHGLFAWLLVLVFLPDGGWDVAWSSTFADATFWKALIGVALLQTMVHWREWARPQAWRQADPTAEMFRPYGRVAALHLAVIAGFWVVALNGGSRELVILLCVAKLLIDVAVALWQAGFKVRFDAVR